MGYASFRLASPVSANLPCVAIAFYAVALLAEVATRGFV